MCRGTQRPNSFLLLFFFCLFISTFSHYTRNRYRHFLFISLFPRTVTLFQICYYPFFIRIYSSVDSLFLVLFHHHRINTTENRTQNTQITEDGRQKTEDRRQNCRRLKPEPELFYSLSRLFLVHVRWCSLFLVCILFPLQRIAIIFNL